MNANVSQRDTAQQGIRDGVTQHIRIRVPQQTALERYKDTPKDQFAFLNQLMDIISKTDAHLIPVPDNAFSNEQIRGHRDFEILGITLDDPDFVAGGFNQGRVIGLVNPTCGGQPERFFQEWIFKDLRRLDRPQIPAVEGLADASIRARFDRVFHRDRQNGCPMPVTGGYDVTELLSRNKWTRRIMHSNQIVRTEAAKSRIYGILPFSPTFDKPAHFRESAGRENLILNKCKPLRFCDDKNLNYEVATLKHLERVTKDRLACQLDKLFGEIYLHSRP
jgi:hypothetical protein